MHKEVLMRRLFAAIGVCTLAVGIIAPAAAASPDAADLSVTISWAGKGKPLAKVGQTATYNVTVTNLGPDTAQQVRVVFGLPDQLNPESALCGSGTPDTATACDFASLAPHATISVTFVARVCCFPKGESRNTTVSGGAVSLTPDPNLGNSFQSLPTKIIGGPGFFFPVTG